MRGLKVCLWIAGLFCLLAVFGLVLPMSTLRALMSLFGGEALPDGPLFVYLIRVLSVTYVGVGVFYILLALRPLRYGPLVPFAGLSAVAVGVACGVSGALIGMPLGWFLGDCISCTVLGILILVFWRQARAQGQEGSSPE
jgi:hypothetical protein